MGIRREELPSSSRLLQGEASGWGLLGLLRSNWSPRAPLRPGRTDAQAEPPRPPRAGWLLGVGGRLVPTVRMRKQFREAAGH